MLSPWKRHYPHCVIWTWSNVKFACLAVVEQSICGILAFLQSVPGQAWLHIHLLTTSMNVVWVSNRSYVSALGAPKMPCKSKPLLFITSSAQKLFDLCRETVGLSPINSFRCFFAGSDFFCFNLIKYCTKESFKLWKCIYVLIANPTRKEIVYEQNPMNCLS